MATKFVQKTVRQGLQGAAIGAAAGMGLSVALQIINKNKIVDDDGPIDETKDQFEFLNQDSDISYVVQDMAEARIEDPKMFDAMRESLNRLCALNVLVHTSDKEKFDPGWDITAHHHARDIADYASAVLITLEKNPALHAEFSDRKEEIDTWVDNTLHNISMEIQSRIMNST